MKIQRKETGKKRKRCPKNELKENGRFWRETGGLGLSFLVCFLGGVLLRKKACRNPLWGSHSQHEMSRRPNFLVRRMCFGCEREEIACLFFFFCSFWSFCCSFSFFFLSFFLLRLESERGKQNPTLTLVNFLTGVCF